MPYEEYDKLAWGLVKDEIRRLQKPRQPHDRVENVVANTLRPDQKSFYLDQGSMNERRLKIVQQQIRSGLQTRLMGFGHSQQRERMGSDTGYMDVEGLYAWEVSELGLTDVREGSKYRKERFLELKHLKYAVGKKRLIADLISCFVIVNEHTLYRLIQRGATNRESLGLLGDDLSQWLGYAAMFMVSHKNLGTSIGNTVFIPYRGGALLGKMAFTELDFLSNGFSRHRIRFQDSVTRGGKVDGAPYDGFLDDVFEGKEGTVTLQISTWIPESYFHSEQWWAKYRIEELAKNFKDVFDICAKSLHSGSYEPESEELTRLSPIFEKFGVALGKLFVDRRWAIACQW